MNLYNNAKSNKKSWIILFFIIILQVILMFSSSVWSTFGGDEYFTYGLSNNTDGYLFMDSNWIKDKSDGTGWISSTDISDYLVVNSGEEFDFHNVLENQKKDVHPPVYYFVIHFLSSFFSNTFSLFIGRCFNIVLFVIMNIILYKLSKRLFSNDFEALVCCAVFGFSNAALSLVTYTRMYMLLCTLCILLTYLHIKIVQSEKIERKNLLCISGVIIVGGLTHYYFYVFAAIQCFLFLCCYVFYNKKPKVIISYIIYTVAGGIFNLMVYPSAINHIFFGYRGNEIKENLFSNKMDSFKASVNTVLNATFNIDKKVLVSIILLGAFLFIVSLIKNKNEPKIKMTLNMEWFLILGSCFGYFIALSIISANILWTYLSPVYAILLLLLIKLLSKEYAGFLKSIYYSVLIIFMIFSLFPYPLGYSNLKNNIKNYEVKNYNKQLLVQERGRDCIFIYDTWDNLFNNKILELLYCDEILTISTTELAQIDWEQTLLLRESEDNLIVFMEPTEQTEDIIDVLEDKIGSCELLYEYNNQLVYFIAPKINLSLQ